jgi:3-deoxy-D-manno-octulosonate 8-phosphate phosphatase KdsC-like HAD superfamily phosphatase
VVKRSNASGGRAANGARGELRRRLKLGPRKMTKIKVIIFDFDGVLTDNRVLVFDDGHEAVLCNRTDGLFIGLLKERGYALFIVSKEQNPVVTVRG